MCFLNFSQAFDSGFATKRHTRTAIGTHFSILPSKSIRRGLCRCRAVHGLFNQIPSFDRAIEFSLRLWRG